MPWGEWLGSGSLSDALCNLAEDVRRMRDNGVSGEELVERTRQLMEGATELYARTVDEEEDIVRCRDCGFFDGECGCTLFDFCMPGAMDDGFCAWGTRDQ